LKEMVAAFATNHLKTDLSKRFGELFTRNGRKVAHAETATRCTPTNSVGTGSSTSRQSSIASLTFFIRRSSDLACV